MTTIESNTLSDFSPHQHFVFGDFDVDLDRGGLTRGGEEISLRPKTFSVLLYLLEHAGQLVSRSELLSAVWPGVVVTDGSIDQCVIELRKALGDDEHMVIRTVPRRGFIFDVPVQHLSSVNPSQHRSPWTMRLRWMAFAGLGTAAALLLWWMISPGPLVSPSKQAISTSVNKAIAVLPFKDLSPLGDQEYFAEGISEDILEQLVRVPGLMVTGRNSSFAFKGSNENLRSIAERLSVAYLLEGNVRMDGKHFRITARLINASDGRNLWSQTFERQLTDIVEVQSNIAESVSRTLQVDAQDTNRFSEHHQPDPEAYLVMLRGQALYRQRSEGDVSRARDLFRQATEIDPDYALAWARLAAACRVLYGDFEGAITYEELIRTGLPAASRALELRPDLAEVQFRVANYATIIGDYQTASAYIAEASRIDPNHPLLQGSLVGWAIFSGNAERAIELQSQLVQRDPLSPFERRQKLVVLYHSGHFNTMRDEAAVVARLFPDEVSKFVTVHLVRAAIVEGKYEVAQSMLDGIPPGLDRDHALALMAGQPGQASAAAEAVLRLQSIESIEAALRLAETWAWQGDPDAAFESLYQALDRFNVAVSAMPVILPIAESRISHFLVPLHDDPRWKTWLSEMPFQGYFQAFDAMAKPLPQHAHADSQPGQTRGESSL